MVTDAFLVPWYQKVTNSRQYKGSHKKLADETTVRVLLFKTIIILLILSAVLIFKHETYVSGRSSTTERELRTLGDFWTMSYTQSLQT